MPLPPDTLNRLLEGTPSERAEIVLGLMRAHPEQRLELAAQEGGGAVLNGIDLGPAAMAARDGGDAVPRRESTGGIDLRSAKLRGVSLRSANLEGADLKAADLRAAKMGAARLDGAMLEEADLQNADLISASLRGAALGGANLKGALLEDADLRQASLRFAVFQNAFLENARLEGADLWGSNLAGAVLSRADLRGVILTESNLEGADLSGADLRDARLDKANLKGVNLAGADLRGAKLPGVNLREASLRHANFERVDLSTCDVTHVHISGALLDRSRIRRGAIGGAIGEEIASRYEEAGHGYLTLEQDFAALGDGDAASWAYRKRRRMQKLTALQMANQRRQQGHTRAAVPFYAKYGRFQLVEWVCDYGESASRVLATLLVVFLLFTLVYGAMGAVVRNGAGTTRNPLHLAAFSLLAMTTSGTSAAGLQPRNEWVLLLTGVQAFLGISLTGLLGFVVGNRLRR